MTRITLILQEYGTKGMVEIVCTGRDDGTPNEMNVHNKLLAYLSQFHTLYENSIHVNDKDFPTNVETDADAGSSAQGTGEALN